MERRRIREHFSLESKYLENPLSEEPVSEEDIKLVEERIGMKIPFHLREFIKITNGRNPYVIDLCNLHYSNAINPFERWTVSYYGESIVIGGIHDDYEPTVIYIVESGRMYMDISTYGTTDSIVGGWMAYMKMTSNNYEYYNPFNMVKLQENFQDFMKIAKYHPSILQQCDDKLKENVEFWKEVTLHNPEIFHYMPETLRKDINIARKVLYLEPTMYPGFHEELKKDRELYDLAVSLDINNYPYGEDSWKLDRELALKFCKEAPFLSSGDFPEEIIDFEILKHFQYFSGIPDNKKTPELAIYFIENDRDVLYEIERDTSLQTPEVLEAIYWFQPHSLFRLKKEKLFTFDTKEIALKVFNGLLKIRLAKCAVTAFNMLPLHLQNDLDVIRAALKNSFKLFDHLSEEVKHDREFILSCWKESKSTDLNFDLYKKDVEFYKILCEKKPHTFPLLEDELVTEEFLNSLKCYCYRGLSFGDILKTTRFEHYKSLKNKTNDHSD